MALHQLGMQILVCLVATCTIFRYFTLNQRPIWILEWHIALSVRLACRHRVASKAPHIHALKERHSLTFCHVLKIHLIVSIWQLIWL